METYTRRQKALLNSYRNRYAQAKYQAEMTASSAIKLNMENTMQLMKAKINGITKQSVNHETEN